MEKVKNISICCVYLWLMDTNILCRRINYSSNAKINKPMHTKLPTKNIKTLNTYNKRHTCRGEYVQFPSSALHLSLKVNFMRRPQLTRCGVQIVAYRHLTGPCCIRKIQTCNIKDTQMKTTHYQQKSSFYSSHFIHKKTFSEQNTCNNCHSCIAARSGFNKGGGIVVGTWIGVHGPHTYSTVDGSGVRGAAPLALPAGLRQSCGACCV